ncbi:MAG: hypothetical protein KatS3mg090_0528 [Patescibacteria group bacterium]|nr:MAG: hypothetical protein KatS3mg090_0528 [Patescibacteria group bacterium]
MFAKPVNNKSSILDERHKKRLQIVQNLYSAFFGKNNYMYNQQDVVLKTEKILQNTEVIDTYIKKYAVKLPFDMIAKIDLSILRLGIYELLFEKELPPKVIIDEAVDLAHELGTEKSYAFVNAVLGKVYEEIKKAEKS